MSTEHSAKPPPGSGRLVTSDSRARVGGALVAQDEAAAVLRQRLLGQQGGVAGAEQAAEGEQAQDVAQRGAGREAGGVGPGLAPQGRVGEDKPLRPVHHQDGVGQGLDGPQRGVLARHPGAAVRVFAGRRSA
jgi:hypothetical protein